MIRITEVAEILGVSEGDARSIVKFFGVISKDGEQSVNSKTGKPFGKPSKLYDKTQVESIISLRNRYQGR